MDVSAPVKKSRHSPLLLLLLLTLTMTQFHVIQAQRKYC